jgi:hypothetical protein
MRARRLGPFGLSRHPKQAEAEYHSPRRRLAEANQQRPPPRVKLDRGVGRPAGIHCVVMQHRYPNGDGDQVGEEY